MSAPSGPGETELRKVATSFAQKIVAGDYETAYGMLSASLQATTSPAQLKKEFLSMIDYGNGPPNFVEAMDVQDKWPDKLPADVGWAYVAITGDNFSEAVTVIIEREHGRNKIRSIEWGRP
jgi:hypothetical protein